MKPTAIMCRAQQARQLTLAADAVLPNVRVIAARAAAAWAKEALAAEKRDERLARGRMEMVGAAPALLREAPSQHDRAFSENPDRGFSDVACVGVEAQAQSE